MNKANPCHVCESEAVTDLLDFGSQVLCNRYLSAPEEPEARFPFAIAQCSVCGLVQISQPVPPGELKARFDWIRYNEQEGHLDDLVETICRLPGVTTASSVGAISFKDDSTVARFQKKGFANTWRLASEKDLGITDQAAGLESIQERLSSENAERIARRRGLCDVLIARHILEHAHAPRRFASALKKLVKPDGCLVFEVPDCHPALARKDYCMPWEEHILYFTPTTFRGSLPFLDFSLVHYQRYLYSNENSLVAIVRPSEVAEKQITSEPGALQEQKLARAYAASFLPYREKLSKALADYGRNHGKIAVFGAGHLSGFWINVLQVQDCLEFVVDDHPKKLGLLMPGSRLPIRPSSALVQENISLCLLSLSPESEVKVVEKNQQFVGRGGAFASIFPGKPNSFAVGVDE